MASNIACITYCETVFGEASSTSLRLTSPVRKEMIIRKLTEWVLLLKMRVQRANPSVWARLNTSSNVTP